MSNYIESKQIGQHNRSNSRAEDGPVDHNPFSVLCEGVLIPLGSLFAIFLIMLGVMFIMT
jgi:hypothetical protein